MLSELFERGVAVKILEGIAAGEHRERSLVLDLVLALAEDGRRISVERRRTAWRPRPSADVRADGARCSMRTSAG